MRTLTSVLAVFLILGLTGMGCGGAKPAKSKKKAPAKEKTVTEDAAEAPAEKPAPAEPAGPPTQSLDLGSVGLEATIEVPEGVQAKKSEWDDITLEGGAGFNITLTEDDAGLGERKAEIESNDVNKLKEFIVADSTTLFYSSEVMGKEEYHFAVLVKVGGTSWVLEDTKGPSYTKEQVQAMLKAAKSLKGK